jgi:tetratricopeptide (TPR) repeat protein
MAEQLHLFVDDPVRAAAPVADAPRAQVAAAEEPEPSASQMDLFGDRWLRASAAHKALEAFDLDAAAGAVREAVLMYPSDTALRERADLVNRLAASLRRARRENETRARALAAIEMEVPAFLGVSWHRSLAESIEQEAGEGAALDGVPAGLHWLRAGDPVRAEQSLRATLAREPSDCAARSYLADALFAQERGPEAKTAYRDALAAAPSEVDITRAADPSVRALPGLAEDEYELPGVPVEWAAAVGLLEGLFLPPSPVPHDWVDAAALGRLPPGVRFYRWLVEEKAARDDAHRIACRREMKALSPRLLAEVLRRKR